MLVGTILRVVFICLQLRSSAASNENNFYDDNPYIMELTGKNFDKVIDNTNYTTMVEFYAPWCGYCQKFKPVMEQVSKKLNGLMNVAAVNCDLSINKRLCSEQGIEGFPTVLFYSPMRINISVTYEDRTLFKRPAKQLYSGERKVAPIMNYAYTKIVNYAKKVTATKTIEKILGQKASVDGKTQSRDLKMMLFSEKDKVFPLLKAIAIDWLGIMDVYLVAKTRLTAFMAEHSALKESHPNISLYLEELLAHQIEHKTKKDRRLVVFDTANDIYYEYDGDSFNKPEIAQFVTEKFGKVPLEGPTSKKHKMIESILTGKNHNAKSRGTRKSREKSKNKRVHDEL
ncbi:hypothetical protein TPHA_0G00520 [Tetrapisispora phaffii CBS 4417]|uniref:Thioredoxin domain-containing protein n=1 Tax=Tetrapisispora phaffii (strain ATCC 24235 / CBS 4417 / NBRC 1672 / NRRL Y-8282 / UCD 70-5) TaxID=1071381 RepID=G8BVG0_TETPH|nr:hypothetical protein TPHA_0G00520 [Tetrapisispora phaffii CBS 4417]CCE63888.1 hypothetical protein TPHA_0G00520 [Tetrapisispora phaffii CBS 4417]